MPAFIPPSHQARMRHHQARLNKPVPPGRIRALKRHLAKLEEGLSKVVGALESPNLSADRKNDLEQEAVRLVNRIKSVREALSVVGEFDEEEGQP